MAENLARQLIAAKLVEGRMDTGTEIGLQIDQALLQDVLGTLVMLELEAMGVTEVKTQPSVQYIDHALVQSDHINADAHLFLQSACERFGIWYSGPGNGISHPVHMEHFGVPGQSLVGCDSHTTAAGALGMLAIGAGGIEVAMAMAGEPLYITMPRIWGIELIGELPDWVSAKDVILELLRRHGVAGAKNCIIEYYGPGLASLSAMDRHVLANMGTEMGATTTVFPSDESTRTFLRTRGREEVWRPLAAEAGCTYDRHDRIDLANLEPLIALPSSPDKVVPVRDVAGEPIYQSYIGSSANPGYRDFAVVAQMLKDREIAPGISLDINPSSRQVLETLITEGALGEFIRAGGRLHQAGCNGCIGMGQAPAKGRNSLRTVTRNFPGRSGTREDRVFLCSPETATASALKGVITDPRTLDMTYPRVREPDVMRAAMAAFVSPRQRKPGEPLPELARTDNTPPIPLLEPLPDRLDVEVILVTGDNISTDDIIPAGNRVLPYWSNVFETARYAFEQIDSSYPQRAQGSIEAGGHAIIGGRNYGQGSSRENAALVPRLLGLRVVVAQSFARIHWQNLACFGVLALSFKSEEDAAAIEQGARLQIEDLHTQLRASNQVTATVADRAMVLEHELTPRQLNILIAGGVINALQAGGAERAKEN
ncbi:MAG: aconitate hydratase [Aquisalimonadaceae bacterium]